MFGLKFVIQKLDIMSGTIYSIEGIVKKIRTIVTSNMTGITEANVKLDQVLTLLETPPLEVDKSAFYFSKFQIDKTIVEGRLEKIIMNEFQQVVGTFTALKKNGQPAKVENARVETDNPAVATAELTGPNEITVKAVEGGVTEATAVLVTVTADADLDEGEDREISVVGALTVTPGEAESLEIAFGDPTDQ